MSEIAYYICDLETTGTSVSKHEVVEISIIRCSDKVQFTKYIIAEYPENASLDALTITRKTMKDLLVGDPKESVVEQVDKFLNEDGLSPNHRCIVGHNIIAFDKKFLHSLWDKCGKTFPANMWMDTMQLTRTAAKKMGIVKPKVNLQAACDLFNIKKTAVHHTAKMDTRNTYFLWKKLLEEADIDWLSSIKTIPHSIDRADELDLEDFT